MGRLQLNKHYWFSVKSNTILRETYPPTSSISQLCIISQVLPSYQMRHKCCNSKIQVNLSCRSKRVLMQHLKANDYATQGKVVNNFAVTMPLEFYLACLGKYVKRDDETLSIGLLLCHEMNSSVVELTIGLTCFSRFFTI